MIDIFLGGAGNSTTIEGEGEKTKYFYVVNGQKDASIALVLIAILMVPLMLCVKPLYLRHQIKKAHHGHGPHVDVHKESIQYEKNDGLEEQKLVQSKN